MNMNIPQFFSNPLQDYAQAQQIQNSIVHQQMLKQQMQQQQEQQLGYKSAYQSLMSGGQDFQLPQDASASYIEGVGVANDLYNKQLEHFYNQNVKPGLLAANTSQDGNAIVDEIYKQLTSSQNPYAQQIAKSISPLRGRIGKPNEIDGGFQLTKEHLPMLSLLHSSNPVTQKYLDSLRSQVEAGQQPLMPTMKTGDDGTVRDIIQPKQQPAPKTRQRYDEKGKLIYEQWDSSSQSWVNQQFGEKPATSGGRWAGLIPTTEERDIVAKAITARLISPYQVRTNNQIKQAAANLKNNPALDMISADASAKARAELEKRGSLLEAFEVNAQKKINVVKPLFEKLFARGIRDISPQLNALRNNWNAKLSGDPETVRAVSALKEYLLEYVKVATGSTTNQGATDSARELIATLLPAASTPKAFMGLIEDQEKMMNATTSAYDVVKERLKSNTKGDNPQVTYTGKPVAISLPKPLLAPKKGTVLSTENPQHMSIVSEVTKRVAQDYDKHNPESKTRAKDLSELVKYTLEQAGWK